MAAQILNYTIHKSSSYSSTYVPENIMVNKSSDQSSRWSSDSNNPPQFLTLKFEKPSIVHTINFGKYEKTHVCNLKRFKIYGGLTDENMIELLDGGLKNDHVQETFLLKHKIDGNFFPCRYIKIVPIQSWGSSFNFSIWFVELTGCNQTHVVKPCMNWYTTCREREAIRLCLKHFRQKDMVDVYDTLQKKTNVVLEHPLLTELHTQLVTHGNYDVCEKLIEQAVNDSPAEKGMNQGYHHFDCYINQQDYAPKWNLIEPVAGENGCDWRPGMRGGHQMCVDTSAEMVYMFGGWDGIQDLADMWAFHIPSQTWNCISKNTEDQGGPSARSCHKMCLDEQRKLIFTLGKYLDSAMRTPENLKSDFYMYDIESSRWTLISEDTGAMGGPRLIFDHQMVIDTDKQYLYVFGGKILTSTITIEGSGIERAEANFSGLYSYHLPTNTWTKLKDDCPQLKSRIGHSMLFHPTQRALYIFAGQRSKEYLSDFLLYELDTDRIIPIGDVASKNSSQTVYVPAVGFTQRATLDSERNEIYVFSGLSKDKDRHNVKNSFWVYNIVKNKWCCIYKNSNSGQACWSKTQPVEPVPRFAHQLVYDAGKKVHYLFGGNPGKDNQQKMRLDDFWALRLCRPSLLQLLRKCKYLIRKHRFEEVALQNPKSALAYLQTEVAAIVDQADVQERDEFHSLASVLFKSNLEVEPMMEDNKESLSEHFNSRTRLFDTLVEFFPDHMTQPKTNLVDLVKLQ